MLSDLFVQFESALSSVATAKTAVDTTKASYDEAERAYSEALQKARELKASIDKESAASLGEDLGRVRQS